MAGLKKKKKPEGSRLGFNLTHVRQGKVVQQCVWGMLYADDIVVLADNQKYVQLLINICAQESTDLW